MIHWRLFTNSLVMSGLATLGSAGLGFLTALWLAGMPERWRHRLLAAALVALALPPFFVTDCWLHWLGHAGVWHAWLPLNIYSLGGSAWILMLLTWPITLIAVWAAWQQLDPAQWESDPALAGWALIRWLLWPLARPAAGLAALVTFTLALNNFAVPAILQVKAFPAELWVSFNTTFDYGAAWRLSWPLVAAPLGLLLWLRRRDIAWPQRQGTLMARNVRRQLGAVWFGLSALIGSGILLISTGLPVLRLLGGSATWRELPAAFKTGFRAARHSALFALAAAAAVVVLGWLGRRCRLGRWLWLSFFVPGVVLGIALIFLMNRPPFVAFYQSGGIVILALTLRYLALGWQGAALAQQRVDQDLVDAARLEGASGWPLFRLAYWPQLAPRLAAIGYVTYLLCLWDVETLLLIVPPGGETLALRVFHLLHYGHTAQVNALSFMLLLLALLPWGMWRIGRAITVNRWRSPKLFSSVRLSLWLALAGGFAGCGPQRSATESALDSVLFSRVEIIGSRGTGLGQFNKPRSVAVDARDNVYVVDMTGRVQKFSPQGVFLDFWQMPQTDKGKPKGMCRDAGGGVVVVEPHYSRINHFSPDGQLTAQWGTTGTNVGQLAFPRAIAINSRREMFVSEYGVMERVQRFTDQGRQWLNSFGRPGHGPGEFNRPEGLGIDAQDRVYVADSCNHRIQVFSRTGDFLRAYGQPGAGKGQLSYPYDVQVDAAGNQFVCEFGNSRIQIFNARDDVVEILGGAGLEPDQFNNPWSLTLDSAGNLYVADSGNHRVQKFIRKK